MSKFIFLSALVFVSATCGFFAGQQTKSSANSATPILEEIKKSDFIKILQDEKIENFQSWKGDKNLFGVTRRLDEPCDRDFGLSSCQKFSVYDETGKVLYELKDFRINSVNFSRLKSNSSQLIIETNGGGTDEQLTIVDYKDGTFTELEVEDGILLRGGWWTMPEYGGKKKGAYFKPSQLIAIQQIGGSDDSPQASVFRSKDNRFQKVGEIKMQELGDFIERQIAENK